MTKFYKRIVNSYPFPRIAGVVLATFLTLNLFSCSDETRDIPKAGDELTFEISIGDQITAALSGNDLTFTPDQDFNGDIL